MKAVSQNFLDAWKAKQGKGGTVIVQYKRRYWNGSAMVYEANWTQYTLRQFVEVGNITWKLDTPLLNDVKTSSVILKFKNSDYQFLPTNITTGIFTPDGIALSGYEPFLMKFQILFGYKLADGTIETTELFTGVAIDYNFNIDEGNVEVTVSGNEAFLQYSDATLVSTPLTNAATTNTSGNNWTTTANGIAFITKVYDNGVPKTQGTDYTISGISSFGVGAVIQLTYVAVGAITYDGASWFVLKKIEELVTDLAIQAGLTSYNISPVIFPGGSGATITDIGLFSGSAYSPTWTVRDNQNTGAVSATGGVLSILSGAAAVDSWEAIDTPCSPSIGLFEMDIAVTRQSLPADSDGNDGAVVMFLQTASVTPTVSGPRMTGYGLRFNLHPGGVGNAVELCRFDGDRINTAILLVTLGTFDTSQHHWSVSRGSDGTMLVYKDNILVGTSAPDNTYTVNSVFGLAAQTNNTTAEITLEITAITNTIEVKLAMADFTGLTCYDAIQRLARLADYEWGFDALGVLFFRSKTPADMTPVTTIDQSDGISRIMDFRFGYGDIINSAQVIYGQYYSKYDSSTLPETSPTSQQIYFTQSRVEDYSDFLLAYDPIPAAGRAQLLHDNNYLRRRRCRIRGKIIPQLDLSDILNYSFYNNPRMADNILGDPLELWGDSPMGLPQNILARNIVGKTIGIIFDPNTCEGEYEVQEVLS